MARAPRFTTFVRKLGVRLTPAQRVLARVAFDGDDPIDLPDEERELARRLFGPIDRVPSSARAVLVVVCGRASGKSYIFAALYSLWRALTADLSKLAPGELAGALIVAPDMRLGRQCLRFVLGAVKSIPELAELVAGDTKDGIELERSDGARVAIEVLPATRGGYSGRGRSVVSVVLEEVAFFRDESAVVNDVDVFKAVAPRVLPGGLIVLVSSPWVEAGLLYTQFMSNFGTPDDALAAHAPTGLMRDDADTAAMIARERRRDPDNAARELDAEFLSGGAGVFFGPELLGPALDRDLPLARSAEPGASVFIGGDVGLVNDASAFVAIHRRGSVLSVMDALEIRPRKGAPLKLSEVVASACAFAGRHGARTIHVDHHVLEPAREHLPKGFTLTAVPGGQEAKAERFLTTRKALREGNVRIAGPLARLCGQLGYVIGKPVAGGGTQIILPRRAGTHLDLAAAFVVGAWAAVRGYGDCTFTPRAGGRQRLAASGLGGF